jgi:hypothetical protein
MVPPDEYTVKVDCENCGYEGEANIIKGTPVEKGGCPNCDVIGKLKRHIDFVSMVV